MVSANLWQYSSIKLQETKFNLSTVTLHNPDADRCKENHHQRLPTTWVHRRIHHMMRSICGPDFRVSSAVLLEDSVAAMPDYGSSFGEVACELHS
eukprot:gene9944-2126_t